MEGLPSSIIVLIRDGDFSNKTVYFGALLSIYEHFYIQDYRSAYVQYRVKCSLFAYCTLIRYIDKEVPANSFPTPLEVFGDNCQCNNCQLVCDNCHNVTETYFNNTVLSFSHQGFVVHHKEHNYGATPYQSTDWHESYGILCRSCNSKFRNDLIQLPDGKFMSEKSLIDNS